MVTEYSGPPVALAGIAKRVYFDSGFRGRALVSDQNGCHFGHGGAETNPVNAVR